MRMVIPILGLVCGCLPLAALAGDAAAKTSEAYQSWTAVGKTIPEPLGGLKGDPANGRKVVINGGKGNCLACHVLPIPEEDFQGETGPSLMKAGQTFSAEQLRLIVVNVQKIHRQSLMPPMYMSPDQLNRVADKFQGRTILTAQEVEDVVAYLVTLK